MFATGRYIQDNNNYSNGKKSLRSMFVPTEEYETKVLCINVKGAFDVFYENGLTNDF